MFERVRHWLSHVDIASPAERRHALVVQVMCIVCAMAVLAGELQRLLTGRLTGIDTMAVMHLSGAAFCVAAFVLLRRGRYRAGVHNLLIGMVGIGAVGVAYSGLQYHLNGIHMLAVPLALAALLIGRRALLLTLGAYALAILVGSARDHGYLWGEGPRPIAAGPFGTAVDWVISLSILAVVLDVLGSRLWKGIAALETEMARRRATEAQLFEAQKMEALAHLSGGIAHDFNNLLTVILSCTSSSKKELPADHPLRTTFDDITNAARRGAELTHQLLTVAQHQVVEPKIVEIGERIQSMDRMLRHALGEGIDLVLDLDRDPWSVHIDPGQLDQVVLNLAINARDAMQGKGTLRVRTAKISGHEAGDDSVELSVADDGCGMSRETAARVFEPFFTTKQQGRGTGLGLASCYGIVQQAGGRISFTTEEGHGTTFRILLPRSRDVGSEEIPASVAPTSVRGSETVLLVEDESTLRGILAHSLRKCGYMVLEATSTDHALSITREYRGEIHILVTDIIMPGRSGRDLAVLVVRHRPAIKVLFVSGYTGNVVLDQGISPDAIEYLGKPFTPDVLVARIRTILDRPPTSTVKRLATTVERSGSSGPSNSTRDPQDLPRT